MSKLDKNCILIGHFCTLIPVLPKDFERIIELRNREENKYFLNQKYDITFEEQCIWYEKYLERVDDVYWGIWKSDDCLIGTIRLYDVEEDSAEEGSCIIDNQYSKEAPYVVEAKYLLTRYAFEQVGVKKIINRNKKDNKVMNSLSRQQGFKLQRIIDINGMEYNYYVLVVDDFQQEKIEKVLDYWKKR